MKGREWGQALAELLLVFPLLALGIWGVSALVGRLLSSVSQEAKLASGAVSLWGLDPWDRKAGVPSGEKAPWGAWGGAGCPGAQQPEALEAGPTGLSLQECPQEDVLPLETLQIPAAFVHRDVKSFLWSPLEPPQSLRSDGEGLWSTYGAAPWAQRAPRGRTKRPRGGGGWVADCWSDLESSPCKGNGGQDSRWLQGALDQSQRNAWVQVGMCVLASSCTACKSHPVGWAAETAQVVADAKAGRESRLCPGFNTVAKGLGKALSLRIGAWVLAHEAQEAAAEAIRPE